MEKNDNESRLVKEALQLQAELFKSLTEGVVRVNPPSNATVTEGDNHYTIDHSGESKLYVEELNDDKKNLKMRNIKDIKFRKYRSLNHLM